VPDPDSNPGLCIQVEVPGPGQSLPLGVSKVHILGPSVGGGAGKKENYLLPVLWIRMDPDPVFFIWIPGPDPTLYEKLEKNLKLKT